MVRTTALQQLQQLPDGESRKRLFLELSPLTAQLLRQFLGRPVSPNAILSQLQRVGSVGVFARQHLGQTLAK